MRGQGRARARFRGDVRRGGSAGDRWRGGDGRRRLSRSRRGCWLRQARLWWQRLRRGGAQGGRRRRAATAARRLAGRAGEFLAEFLDAAQIAFLAHPLQHEAVGRDRSTPPRRILARKVLIQVLNCCWGSSCSGATGRKTRNLESRRDEWTILTAIGAVRCTQCSVLRAIPGAPGAAGLLRGGCVGVVRPALRSDGGILLQCLLRAQEAGGTKDGHCNLAEGTYPQGGQNCS